MVAVDVCAVCLIAAAQVGIALGTCCQQQNENRHPHPTHHRPTFDRVAWSPGAACYAFDMLPALIVGLLTGWYLGLRAGIIAGLVTAGAMLVAQFVPGLSLLVYGLVVAWSAAVYFLGTKITKRTLGGGLLGNLGTQVRSLTNKLFGRK